MVPICIIMKPIGLYCILLYFQTLIALLLPGNTALSSDFDVEELLSK